MEDKKNKPSGDPESEQAQVSESPAEKAPVFSLERLRRDCLKVFSVTSSTFDGATHGLEGEFTLAKMREIITEWQKKPLLKT